ncbi:ankyrin repeat domain-containing protein [Pseudomonas sp. KNUC1026]|uniref:ankyrin repeat domain-containing protein n=1 Tax=Pseudomonas sp. KNUC1026 TaxID=2893890 RepID=UPI001F22E57F|nr:ankyrin repeat domain-containing protein [Pseudomonas sp. KNUC1026]UFH49093.1 ankyrin repeat domain-containing protein [Pseudomonas sp. KNUC1026]
MKLLQKLKSSIKKKDNAFVLDQLSNDPSLARASSDPELGEYLLHVAAEKGNREVLEALLANGCPVDVPYTDEGNATALEIAADHGHLEACEVLLAAGANINGQPDGLLSPLIAATIANRKAVVAWLIEKGASLNRLHAWANRTALDHALGWEHEAIVELLKHAGQCSIQASDEPSQSAEGTVETFIHNTIGWVTTQAVVPQPRQGTVGLKLSLVEAKNNQKVLFTSGLVNLEPRMELLVCLDACWPLPCEGIPQITRLRFRWNCCNALRFGGSKASCSVQARYSCPLTLA